MEVYTRKHLLHFMKAYWTSDSAYRIDTTQRYTKTSFLLEAFTKYNKDHSDSPLSYDELANKALCFYKLPGIKNKEKREKFLEQSSYPYDNYESTEDNSTIYNLFYYLSEDQCEAFIHGVIFDSVDYWRECPFNRPIEDIASDFEYFTSRLYYAYAKILGMNEDTLLYMFDTHEALDSKFYRERYVHDVLDKYMKVTGESALSLSKKVEIGHSTISKLINGTDTFSLKQFRLLAPYLNIPSDIKIRCEQYIAFLHDPEVFRIGMQHEKQLAKFKRSMSKHTIEKK